MTQQNTEAFEAHYLERLERLYAIEAERFPCLVSAEEITGGAFEGFG